MSDLVSLTLSAAHERAREGARADLRARGVVATPSQLARRGVARVDELLRTELGMARGLADERVVIVDPAVGTGVWLAALLEHTRALGARSLLLGFDSDPAALSIVERLLAGEAATQGARLVLSCANTLELATPFPEPESVRVILGNPPWAARSLSRGGALSDAWLAEFRRDHLGAPLGERRSGVLSDDYVRFFRWALEHARSAENGAVLCFASNASFLDGPVHRGMRAALLKAFDLLELVDLGGNALLSRMRDGERARDDNLFGVRVGAAISWAVRRPTRERVAEASAHVRIGELRGALPDKLSALENATLTLTSHLPSAPWFGFRPSSRSSAAPGFSIAEAFPFQREGVQTNRDSIAIAGSQAELTERLHELASGRLTVPALRHFDPARMRARLSDALEAGESCIAKLAYRPLDLRYFVTLAPLCHRPRGELLRAMSHSPIALLAVRKERGAAAFNLFGAAHEIADACFLSTRSSCRTRVFPSHQPDGSPNLSVLIAAQIGERIGRLPTAAEVIAYALSVLGSPRHRREQQAALQLDYAHLPWPRDLTHFERAQQVGRDFVSVLSGDAETPRFAPERATDADPSELLTELVFQDGCLSQRGRPLLHGVDAACWNAQVGHHALVASLLRRAEPVTLARLVDTLDRATAWRAAERAADTLLFD